MARPPKPTAEQRSESFSLRFTPAERTALDARAARVGLSPSDFVRRVALRQPLPSRQLVNVADPATIAAINRCGAQLNMIARALHMQQGFVPADLAENLARLNALADRLQGVDDAA